MRDRVHDRPGTGRLSLVALFAMALGATGACGGGQDGGGTGGVQATGTGGVAGSPGHGGAGGTTSTGGSGPGTGGGSGGTSLPGHGGGAGTTASGGAGGVAGSAGGARGGAGGAGGAGGGAGQQSGAGGGTAGAGGHAGGGGAAASGGASGGAGGSTGDQYRPCPTTAGTACAILPLGDSITEGWLPTGSVGGYRVELFTQAVLGGKNITFVGSQTSSSAPSTVQNQSFPKHHEGHDGYTIDTGSGSSGISGSITDQAMASYHPNIVLLMIGTNDVNGNIDVTNAPARLGKLIDEITSDAPAALVVVASIIPIASNNNQKAMAYNSAIPGLVSSRAAAGKHIVYVDNYAAFVKDASYQTSEMSNYLHPNTAGYAVLGDSFYKAISSYLP